MSRVCKDTAPLPFHELVGELGLGQSPFTVCYHPASATSLGSMEEQCKIGTFRQRETAGTKEKCLCLWIYDPGDCKPAGPQHCKWRKRTVGHT